VLPATARVRHGGEFAAVLGKGGHARRGGVVVHAARRADGSTGGARVGFIVSKAVGPAVTRNLVKRRLRHLAADRLTGWPPDTDVVVRALPSAADTDYQRLGTDLTDAMTAILRRRT
jgi:ribonuclease P protein component